MALSQKYTWVEIEADAYFRLEFDKRVAEGDLPELTRLLALEYLVTEDNVDWQDDFTAIIHTEAEQ